MSDPRRRPGPHPRFPADELRTRVFTAARAEFAAHGAQGASVAAIARAAGVSRQSVYEQFGDKGALFAAVAEDLDHRLHQAVADAPDLDAALRAVFTFHRANPGAHRLLADTDRRVPDALITACRREHDRAADLLAALCLALAETAATADTPDDTAMTLLAEFVRGGLSRLSSSDAHHRVTPPDAPAG
ncbi:TetR/AcrR family transcriptional regulator [Actinokineospora soli]|uniref:TetR/AcrR family transcriptional regulator n=1 Tax=Actinokineospora soli TaxID=1048753 RepID=A0ABW2TWD0_9PSEU